ncbi:MAG: dockerin type I repeat-containing protein [Clostridia bacterium]|nr:dockerin type I repeat-containing protein [Clostridia bacterium]
MKKILSFAVAIVLALSAVTAIHAAPSAPAAPDPAYNSLNIWIEDTALDLGSEDTVTVYVSVSDNTYGFEYMKFYLVYPACLTLRSADSAGFASGDDFTSGIENMSVTGPFKRAMSDEGLSADEVLGVSEDGTYKNKWTSVFIDCAREEYDDDAGENVSADCFENGRIAAFEFKYDESLNDSEDDVLPMTLIASSDYLLHCDNDGYELGGKNYFAVSHGGAIELLGRLPDTSPYNSATIELSGAVVSEGADSAKLDVSVYKNPGFTAVTAYVIYDEEVKFGSFDAGDVFTSTSFRNPPTVYAGSRDRTLQSLASTDAALKAELEARGTDAEGKLAAVIKIENDEVDGDYLPVDETDNGKLFSITLDPSALAGGEYEVTLICTGAVNKSGETVAFDTVSGTLTVTNCSHETTTTANEISPTCVRRGSYDVVCTACGKMIENVIVSALGHDYGESLTVSPSCTEDGYVTYKCSRCGDEKRTVTPATGHSFSAAETVLPTCEKPGYTLYECANCDATEMRDETPAIGHYYVRSVFSATCTEGGYTLCKCSNCGDSFVMDETEALGHDYTKTVIEPTCKSGGFTKYRCSRCGDGYIENEIPAIGHDYKESVVEATCERGSYSLFKCSRCGDEYTENETEPLGHDYVENKIDATCTEGGYTAHTCTRCGDTFKTDETDPAGHDTSANYKFTVQPTKTTDGLRTKACPICGEVLESLTVKYYCGDVDGNGKINSRDISTFKKYISNSLGDDEVCIVCSDINEDGKLNTKDLSALKRIVAQ